MWMKPSDLNLVLMNQKKVQRDSRWVREGGGRPWFVLCIPHTQQLNGIILIFALIPLDRMYIHSS
jgi:hypothetical protein